MTRLADGADLVALGTSTYLRVTTFRRDGRPVSTPVWPVVDRADLGGQDRQLLVTTGAETGKAKRLRHTPRVLLAPCDARGRVTPGVEELEATAEVLADAATYRRARSLLVPQHPFLSRAVGVVRRLAAIRASLQGRPPLREVTLRIVAPDDQ